MIETPSISDSGTSGFYIYTHSFRVLLSRINPGGNVTSLSGIRLESIINQSIDKTNGYENPYPPAGMFFLCPFTF